MAFHPIDMQAWERQTHYEAYTTCLPLNWNVTVELDITKTLAEVRKNNFRFYPVILYLAIRSVNQIKAFRMGYDKQGILGWYDTVHPSYTVFHKDDETFSDIWSIYHDSFKAFYSGVTQDMEKWGTQKGYKGRPDPPENCCPVSMVPWLPFTSCAFDTFRPTKMLRPILTFGKYFSRDQHIYLPFSICASHAIADGWHAAKLVNVMQALANSPEIWLYENINSTMAT